MKTRIDSMEAMMVTDTSHHNNNRTIPMYKFAGLEKQHPLTLQTLRTLLLLSNDNKGTNNKTESLVRLMHLLITRHL